MKRTSLKRTSLLAIALLLSACGRGGPPDAGDDSGPPPDQAENGGPAAAGEGITLTAEDGVEVFGTLRRSAENGGRVALLFHQARSNRHEYDPIAGRLIERGWDTLAIDQRSGGEMWGQENRTVEALGSSAEYREALPDLQAALDWAVEQEYETIVAVGSSYSAALVYLLAEENEGQLDAIAAFSPGEYVGEGDSIKNAAAAIDIPVYATAGSGSKEQGRVDEVLSKTTSEQVVRYRPEHGVHGASTLRADKNPEGAEENFAHFAEFLEGL